MSWLRFSDDFTDWQEWDHVGADARWGYVCLVIECSRGKFWDGRLPTARALRALIGRVESPQPVLEQLAMLSLIHEDRRERLVILPRIHDHVPPPGVRRSTEQSKRRMRRKRAHDADDHSLCDGKCTDPLVVTPPATQHVTQIVTRNTGTGQDRTGNVLPARESDDS